MVEGTDAAVVRELLSPLMPFLEDRKLYEVIVNRPGEVLTEGPDGWCAYDVAQLTFEKLMRLARAVATFSNQSIDETRPILSATLPGRERIQIVIPPATSAGIVSITIRKPSSLNLTLDDLEERGFFGKVGRTREKAMASPQKLEALYEAGSYKDFLREAVVARKNIIISGATGSAKTTLCKALIQHIPADERIISIEDTPELVIPQPNHVPLHYSKGEQGVSPIGAKDLLESSLRMRPDRILLQELRDGAAFYYMRNVNSGHPGSITTVHADNPYLAFEQLTLLVKESAGGSNLDRVDIRQMLSAAIDIIVQCKRTAGRFFISEIYFQQLQASLPIAAGGNLRT